ncbi:D-xylulose kinase [Hoeflea sp. IMCC20628]|uniref:xylulokinase n=1 Tax=Hoeflea sp. IMCC20628 TaxID=1620421 RepID=UPI00063AF393|nr:xylulokinase [Hoeflea sp. IMCC20628]AKH99013.1 D-xylulose kinase [Hoeflea sp. IMCC20628]
MYLGLDLGTSSLKALLIDADQRILGSASAPLTVERPHPGWSEQDPDSWITATKAALAKLAKTHAAELAKVRGIGLSGHMHGATTIDKDGKVIRPCILWNDTRSYEEAAALDADPQFRRLTGNIVFPGFTAPKLKWMAANEPEAFARVAKVLLPKDYLRLWLSGESISEMSDSAGTSWLDVGKRAWDDGLLAATGLDRSQMPSLVEGTERAGALRAEAALELGLPAGIPIAGGAGDNAASACGMGTVANGQAFASLGTSGVLFAANNRYLPNPDSAVHAFCHALPGTWHQMGVILSATDSLNWLSGITSTDPSALTAELGDSLVAPGSVLFLPYLSGERTPHNDATIRGAFAGLGHESDRTAMTRAVVEGVAFAFRDSLAALAQAGTSLSRVTAIGGGSRSGYWTQALATVLGMPVDIPEGGDFGAAFGAARLGLIAAEAADPFAICTPPATAKTIHPKRDLAAGFDEAYQRYRALYPAIKGAMS